MCRRRFPLSFIAMPIAPRPPTTQRIGIPHRAGRATRQMGTYVPAMSRKIIEWSSRCMIIRARGVWARRW